METTEKKHKKNHFCCGPRRWIGWVILGIIGFTAFAFLFGAVIMWLWNGLMPVIFHLGVITYWQALGIAVLARLLFGSLHHGGPHHRRWNRTGRWGHGHFRNPGNNCRDYSNSEKWNYYEQYWEEEGEKSFNDYIKRKAETTVKE
jgi:hypothetical protein